MKDFFYIAYFSCDQIRDFAYDYLDRNLNIVTAARFKMHLHGCPECQEYVRLYEMAADAKQFVTENPLPPELLEHTLRFLQVKGITKNTP